MTISVIVYFIARMALPQLVHSMSIIVASSPQLYTDFQTGCNTLQKPFQWHPIKHFMDTLSGESVVNILASGAQRVVHT